MEWLAGAVLGSVLALLVSALANALIDKAPPAASPWPPPAASPSAMPAPEFHPPGPVPDRNEIRLPLPPPQSGPIQTQAHPPAQSSTPAPSPSPAPILTLWDQAVARGDTSAMENLLAQGAAINQPNAQARTALDYAVSAGNLPLLLWLLAHGADPDLLAGDGASPLDRALATWNLALIEPVLWARAPRPWTPATREALFTAVRTQNKPLIATLLAAHQGPPTLEASSLPLLAYTLIWGDEAQFLLLLECGADPNTRLSNPLDKPFLPWIKSRHFRGCLETETGVTVLMIAAAQGRLECVEALVAYGAKRSTQTARSRWTAMDFAARYDASPEMLQVLLGKSPRSEDQRMWVDISIDRQRATFYKDGAVAFVTQISTGKPGYPTPTGRFVVTDKDRLRMSSIYHGAYMPYFMRMSCRDFGMHAGDVPGYPASHGCIRLPYSSAERLFREVEIGTLVTISR